MRIIPPTLFLLLTCTTRASYVVMNGERLHVKGVCSDIAGSPQQTGLPTSTMRP